MLHNGLCLTRRVRAIRFAVNLLTYVALCLFNRSEPILLVWAICRILVDVDDGEVHKRSRPARQPVFGHADVNEGDRVNAHQEGRDVCDMFGPLDMRTARKQEANWL